MRLQRQSPWHPHKNLILISDPGPDPDDIKALLVAAVLHRQGVISLRTVIANGGQQAEDRAALALTVLDHVDVHDVPVGIGSQGKAYVAQPHEYAMRGFERVDRSRLHNGGDLLRSQLKAAPHKSLTIVCISSLSDFADVIEWVPDLVLAKVAVVAVQGGLEVADEQGFPPGQTASIPVPRGEAAAGAISPSLWRPDTSVNNSLDMAAAELVYGFCLRRGLPMRMVSRHVVPMVPMQLARSFAYHHGSHSEVMRYLADAQFLGLSGLWAKLCQGNLPTRCTKQWYYQTFCGVGPAEFECRGLDRLDADHNIITDLNGYVKPYDVVALMTVLVDERLFDGSAWVNVGGTRHLLLLQGARPVPETYVVDLLRETYHETVSAASRSPRPCCGSCLGPACIARRVGMVRPCDSILGVVSVAGPPLSPQREGSPRALNPTIQSEMGGHLRRRTWLAGRRSTRVVPGAGTVPVAWEEMETVLSRALAQANRRQAMVSIPAIVIGLTVVSLAFLAMHVHGGLGKDEQRIVAVEHSEDRDLIIWSNLARTSAYFVPPIIFISLHHTESHRRTLQGVMIISSCVALVLVSVWASELSKQLHGGSGLLCPTDTWSGSTSITEASAVSAPSGSLDDSRCEAHLARSVELIFRVAHSLLVFMSTIWVLRTRWMDLPRLLRGIHQTAALYIAGSGVGSAITLVAVDFTDGRTLVHASQVGLVLAAWVAAGLILSPVFRRAAQRALARVMRANGNHVALAAMLGHASGEEWLPSTLVARARSQFQPFLATDEALAGVDWVTGMAPPRPSLESAHTDEASSGLPRDSGPQPQPAVSAADDVFPDFLVLHSPCDNPRAKAAAVSTFAAGFAAENGREPIMLMVESCLPEHCTRSTDNIALTTCHVQRCWRLLVLWGPRLLDDLRVIAAFVAWFTVQRGQHNVQPLVLARTPEEAAHTVTAVDTFHVKYSRAEHSAVHNRVMHAVDLFGTFRVNALVRSFLDEIGTAPLVNPGTSQPGATRIEDAA